MDDNIKWERLRQEYNELKAEQAQKQKLLKDRQALLKWVSSKASENHMKYGQFVAKLERRTGQ